MSLLGRHAWWIPRWLDRILPNLDIEGSAHLARTQQQQPTPASTATPD
jgi:RND superfamily putative drug exporter